MKAKGGTWTYDELFKFLKSPSAYIPGTKMSFAGLPRAKDRINLIAYLRTNADTPAPIPAPAPKARRAPPITARPQTSGAAKSAPAADTKPADTARLRRRPKSKSESWRSPKSSSCCRRAGTPSARRASTHPAFEAVLADAMNIGRTRSTISPASARRRVS